MPGIIIGIIFGVILIGGVIANFFIIKFASEYQNEKAEFTEILFDTESSPYEDGVKKVLICFTAENFPYVDKTYKEGDIIPELQEENVLISLDDANNTFKFLFYLQHGPTMYPTLEQTIPRDGKTKNIASLKIKNQIQQTPWGGWLAIKFPISKDEKATVLHYGSLEECKTYSDNTEHVYTFSAKNTLKLFEIVSEDDSKTE